MQKADCFNLGYIAKLHGFKGEVSLFLDVTQPSEYANLSNFFIEINGFLAPFFVEKITLRDKGFAQVKLEGIDSEEEAKVLLRKEVFLPLDLLPALEGNEFYDHEVIGYKVIDEQFGYVGEVEQVLDYKVNPLLQIINEGKEVLIPLINNLVVKVDRAKKELTVNAPDGLIELYLGA